MMRAQESPSRLSRFRPVAPLLTGLLLLFAAIGTVVLTSRIEAAVGWISMLFLVAGLAFGLFTEFPRILTALFLYVPLLLLSLPVLLGNWPAYILPLAAVISTHAGMFLRKSWSTRRRTSAVVAGVGWAGLLAILLVFVLPGLNDITMNSRPETSMPHVAYHTSSGDSVTVASLRGKVVLFNYWASWCGPCREEFPELQAVYDRYKDHPGVAVLAVNTGWEGETVEKAEHFMRSGPYTLPIAFDRSRTCKDSLGIYSIPVSLIVDQEGIIRFCRTGYVARSNSYVDLMAREIDALLKN